MHSQKTKQTSLLQSAFFMSLIIFILHEAKMFKFGLTIFGLVFLTTTVLLRQNSWNGVWNFKMIVVALFSLAASTLFYYRLTHL